MGNQRTVTLMFTDIEGSTRLVRQLGPSWGDVLARHQLLVRRALSSHHGLEISTEGDSFFVVFFDARSAADCAKVIHEDMEGEEWPDALPVRLRIGLHTGSVEEREGNWVGFDIHKAARIGSAAHGGQTVVSEATSHVLDSDHSLVDLGEHRLKDIPGLVRLFQCDRPGTRFPPLRTLDARVVVLPLREPILVGRSEDTQRVLDLLNDEHRLISLVGPAGVGKTSLAVSLAHEYVDEGRGGAVMISLGSIVTSNTVVPEISRVLNAPSQSVADVASMCGGDCLMVLDNCEQITDIDVALRELLIAAPTLRILITSQAPLHCKGENLVHVRPLPQPVGDNMREVEASPAADLFCARVRAIEPGFSLTPDNAAPIAAICRRLDGNPLALELAAARCQAMTPAQLLVRLDDAVALLRSRTSTHRHDSLRAALQWTLSLLPPEAQLVAMGLGVFEGGWTLELAERVTERSEVGINELDVMWAMEDLMNFSVVRRSQDHDDWLEWPQAFRDLARSNLEDNPAELERWSRAHASVMLQTGRQCSENQDRALSQMEASNLLRAILWADACDEVLHTSLVSIAYPLTLSHTTELEPHVRRALGHATDALERARLLKSCSQLSHYRGDLGDALELLIQADALWEQLDRPIDRAEGLLDCAYMLGSVNSDDHRTDGWLDQAEFLLDSADAMRVRAIFMRAQLMVMRGDADGARSVLVSLGALKSSRSLTQLDLVSHAHLSADCELLASEYDRARRGYGTAFRLALELGDLRQCSIETQGVAMALGGLGRFDQAARLLGAAERMGDDLQFHPHYVWWSRLQTHLVHDPGRVALGEAQFDDAMSWGHGLMFEQAMDIALDLSSS